MILFVLKSSVIPYINDPLFCLRFGTSHKMNGIVIQPGHFAEIVNDSAPPKTKRCRKSFEVTTEQRRTDYFSGNRIGPTSLTFSANDDRGFLLKEQSRINLSLDPFP